MLKKLGIVAFSGMMSLGLLAADATAMGAQMGGAAVAAAVPAVAADQGVVEKVWHRGRPHRVYRGPRYFVPRYVPAPRYVPRVSSRHVAWCSARYRSYRAYDNTFQPYNGPRQQCRSPYWR
jgi:hypothetical protein